VRDKAPILDRLERLGFETATERANNGPEYTRRMLIGPKDQQLFLNVQLLSDFPDGVLSSLLKDAFVQGLPKGAILYEQGAGAQFLHVILAGRVAITSGIAARETIIRICESGEVILDSATMLGVPYTTGARVIESGRIMMIPVSKFRELVFTDATASSVALRAVVNSNLKLAQHIRDLKLLTTIQRLARHILSLAATGSGSAEVVLRDDRLVLAALLGMTPESLSRAFAQLRTIGVRADKAGTVHIESVKKLSDIASAE